MRPSQTVTVLEDLRCSFSGPLYRQGVRLSRKDRRTVLEVYQQWLLLLLDVGYLTPVTFIRDANRLWLDITKVDVLQLNNSFAELLQLVRLQNNKGFKALCSIISPHFHSLIKEDMKSVMNDDVFAAKRLMQVFAYTGRLSLQDIDLTQQCLDDYLEVERNMSTFEENSIVRSLNIYIRYWMKSFDPDRIHFGHGPGGVAGHGRCDLEVKYKDLTFDNLTSYAFGDPWWIQSPIPSNLDRISQTVFVPKSYKTFRTISMEPSTLQYLQQGIWKEIDRVVSSDHWLRNRIGFHEQDRNQKLAKRGSIDRNYATIDLSAASDSVSYDLVKRVFRGTKLLRYLVATRSKRTILPDGRVVELKKFAPMGSALCFPIETIIFAATCNLVTRRHGLAGDFSVFGDDIIIPTQCAIEVIDVLERLGFCVNKSKSFYSHSQWFRESCGAEYVDGFDVTPMRVSRTYTSPDSNERLTGLIDLADNAYEYGFDHLRSFLIRKLKESIPHVRFSPDLLRSDNYTNYHLERRWNGDLHRIECKAYSPQSIFDKDQDEAIRLRHWFESTHQRVNPGDGFVSTVIRPSMLHKARWLEKPYEDQDQDLTDFFTNVCNYQSILVW